LLIQVGLPSSSHAEEEKIDRDWRFHIDPQSVGMDQGWARVDFDDARWSVLEAGKSWSVQGYFNYSGIAWYRKRIELSPGFRGKFLIFYGANDRSTVFFDGVQVTDHRPTSNPRFRGFFRSTPPFRLRLPNRPSVLVAIRIEGMDTHAISAYTPGPGLAGDVKLSNEVLMRFRGYWLAPDEWVTRDQWLAAMRQARTQRRAELHRDSRIYVGPYSWSRGDFVQTFIHVYDTQFYDARKGRYRIEEYLDDGVKRFGGYDSILLWYTSFNIGVDNQNQFDMLRDMPGGFAGLKEIIHRAHARGVKVFIAFNPWDRDTRPEGRPAEESLAEIVKQVGADGAFLDTTDNNPQERMRREFDARLPGTVFDTEGCPGDEGINTVNGCWGQTFPSAGYYGHIRGLPVVKWTEPRVMIHYDGDVFRHDRSVILQHVFLNGTGVVIWENIFGAWNRYSERQQTEVRRFAPILRYGRDLLASDAWEPFYPTLLGDVDAHYWPGPSRALWTIVNWGDRSRSGAVLRALYKPGRRYFDLWHGVEISPTLQGGTATLTVSEIEPHGFGAILALDGEPDSLLRTLLARQHREAAKRLADYSDEFVPPSSPSLRFVERTSLACPSAPPPNMILVPAIDNFMMRISHNLGEPGCYPDDDGADWSQRQHFMDEDNDHYRNIHHAIRVPHLPAFFMDEFLVTKLQYQQFLEQSGYQPGDLDNFLKDWDWTDPKHPKPPMGKDNHPVVWVDLDDARAYAQWAGKRLPTEEEWQYAAGGKDYLRYPWGNRWEAGLANDDGSGTTPIDAFPQGKSPFGLYDMSGNVWEWTESERDDGNRYALLRGGSYYQVGGSAWYFDRYVTRQLGLGERSARPVNYHAKLFLMGPSMDRKSTIGFRCVKDAMPQQ
jgi:formylglycine-generating enzyme required for sulfatase activity